MIFPGKAERRVIICSLLIIEIYIFLCFLLTFTEKHGIMYISIDIYVYIFIYFKEALGKCLKSNTRLSIR